MLKLTFAGGGEFRVQRRLAGRRGGGIQLLNASVFGAESPAAAAAEFERVLARVVVPR